MKINFYDFCLPDYNIIIEYHGERFHPNPNKLTKKEWENWKVVIFSKNTAYTINTTEKHKIDKDKKNLAISNGYDYLELWSSDTEDYNWEKINNILTKKGIEL